MSEAAGERATQQGHRWFAPLAKLRARLRNRPDSEHELTLNRLALSGIVFGYLVVAGALGSAAAQDMLRTHGVYFALYYAVSVAFFGHILYRPETSRARRMLGIFFDIGMFSYGMYIGGEATAPFFPIYLWVIFGNGFRFGIPYLAAAAATSLAGFGIVVLTTEFWEAHQSLGAGLLASLVFLPLYVSTLIRKLSAAKRQAEEASKAKSLFLASVSHELRTPLNAVIGLSDMLLGSRLDAEQKDMARTIGSSGRSLLALINSILDFARTEAGHMPKSDAEFDLHALISEVRKMLAVGADAKNVRLAVHISPRVPRLLRGSRQHLNDILMNLTANAVKFTERGYVVIGVDAVGPTGERVRLRFEITDTGIGIDPKAQARIFDSFVQADETIIDRFGGTGLGLALVKQLVQQHGGEIGVHSTPGIGSTFWCEVEFEAAATALPAWSPRGMPVVLLSNDDVLRGLLSATGADARMVGTFAEAAASLARWAEKGRRATVLLDARLAGDDLEACARGLSGDKAASALVLVADAPIEGMPKGAVRSWFATALARPLDAASLSAALQIAKGCNAPDRADDSPEFVRASNRKLTVLVAEDNRTNQKVIAKVLERAGHETRIVENGEAAIDALAEQAFDIVLMDVNMPVMNGIETTKLYRFASLGQPRIPIIALTADATAEMDARCREAGMDGCMTKPIEPARLLEIIDQMVPEHAAAEGADLLPHDGVTDISTHPKFQAGAPLALNTQVLDDLKALGGKDFIVELAAQFSTDATALLGELAIAAAAGDVQSFRERAHALRSGAANIGAQGIYEMCLIWRNISEGELGSQGGDHVSRLDAELDRVRSALANYLAATNSVEPIAPAPPPLLPRLVASGR